MTNPNNIVRLHSRNGGRGSVYEANQWAQVYNTGNLTGDTVTASSGLSVEVAGSSASPSVIIAENNVGYKIALDLVTTTTLTLTTPTTNSKITAIVAYTDDLAIASEETDVTGNPATCGLIAVDGTTAASPVVPTDTQIRAGITADGATGSQAVYAVLAYITLASDTTDITDTLIESVTAEQNTTLAKTSTLQGAFPRKSVTKPVGYGIYADFDRVANLVIVTIRNVNATPNVSLPQATDYFSLNEKVPAGFRPAGGPANLVANASVSSGVVGTASFLFLNDGNGTIRLNTGFTGQGAVRLNGTTVYVTDDEWPED